MNRDLVEFSKALASIDQREVDTAVALLWFLDRQGEPEATTKQLANLLHDLSLRPNVNASRLAKALAKHPTTMRGRAPDSFKLRLPNIPLLDEHYGPLTKPKPPEVQNHIIDEGEVAEIGNT